MANHLRRAPELGSLPVLFKDGVGTPGSLGVLSSFPRMATMGRSGPVDQPSFDSNVFLFLCPSSRRLSLQFPRRVVSIRVVLCLLFMPVDLGRN